MNLDEINNLQAEIKTIEDKRLRTFSFYTIFMVVLGASITFWSGWEANRGRQLKKDNQRLANQIDSLEARVARGNERLVLLQGKLLNSYTVSSYLRVGLENFYSGNYEMAINEYNEALKLDPENYVLYDFRGYSEYKLRKFDEAIKSLQKSIALNPNYGWGMYNLTLALWANNQKEEAGTILKRLVETDRQFIKTINSDVQFVPILKDPSIRNILK